MTTTDGFYTSQLFGGVHGRSPSVSPTGDLAENRPSKRRRIARSSSHDSKSSSDDDNQPSLTAEPSKPSGLLSLFRLSRGSRKDSTSGKTSSIEQEQHAGTPPDQCPEPLDTYDTTKKPKRRRSSLERLKDFFTRKRKDSGGKESTVPSRVASCNCRCASIELVDVHHKTGVQYFSPSLEPLAIGKFALNYQLYPANLYAVSPLFS